MINQRKRKKNGDIKGSLSKLIDITLILKNEYKEKIKK